MGDRDHQPYPEPLLAEQVDYYRARRPVHLATRSALRRCLLRFLALPRPARAVRVLLVAGRWGPRSGWPGLLRRRWLPNARRADRGRGVVDNTPAPARRHSVPRGQGSVSPAELEHWLRRLGWRVEVHPTSGPFFWGFGTRRW